MSCSPVPMRDMTQICGMPHRASQLSETEAVRFSGIDECAHMGGYGSDPVPVLYPARMRDLALHRPGLTPADEANSAGVMNPSDV